MCTPWFMWCVCVFCACVCVCMWLHVCTCWCMCVFIFLFSAEKNLAFWIIFERASSVVESNGSENMHMRMYLLFWFLCLWPGWQRGMWRGEVPRAELSADWTVARAVLSSVQRYSVALLTTSIIVLLICDNNNHSLLLYKIYLYFMMVIMMTVVIQLSTTDVKAALPSIIQSQNKTKWLLRQ